MAFQSFEDVTEHLPHFIEKIYNRRRLRSALVLKGRPRIEFDYRIVQLAVPNGIRHGIRLSQFRSMTAQQIWGTAMRASRCLA